MSNIKEMMRQAHSQSKQPSTSVEHEPIRHKEPSEPKKEIAQPIAQNTKKLPTGALQIARSDIPETTYGVKSVVTNFSCYNKELLRFLKEFSSNNQFSGGIPITKSQFVEIALDVIYYDLGIRPIGYESHEELREDIQRKIMKP